MTHESLMNDLFWYDLWVNHSRLIWLNKVDEEKIWLDLSEWLSNMINKSFANEWSDMNESRSTDLNEERI